MSCGLIDLNHNFIRKFNLIFKFIVEKSRTSVRPNETDSKAKTRSCEVTVKTREEGKATEVFENRSVKYEFQNHIKTVYSWTSNVKVQKSYESYDLIKYDLILSQNS